ncbi:MAG: T9SS type A sorting domain-containing protein [Chitinophagales bacterium]
MKKILTITLFLFQLSLQAQTDFRFADPTSVWNVWVHNSSNNDVVPYSVVGDAVVNGNNYQQMSYNTYLRRDSTNKVYRWIGHDTLLYDFGAQIGDTVFTIAEGYQSYPYPAYYVVSNIDTVFIGKPRLRMFLYGTQVTTWIDGIGDVRANPLTGSFESDGPGISNWHIRSELSCFFEQGQLLYGNPGSGNCITDIKDDKVDNAVLIYPLPASNQFTIECSTDELRAYRLYTADGKLVKEDNISVNKTTVNCNGFAAGIYILHLQLKGSEYYRKLIID